MVWRKLSIISLSTILSACAPRYTPPPNLPSSVTQISTPGETKQWLETVLRYQYDEETYGKDDYWASCSSTYEKGAGDCDDYAICAAALLQGDVEQGYIVSLYDRVKDDKAHAIFIYQIDGRWGAISNQSPEYREPLFVSWEMVINDVNRAKDPPERYTKYAVYDYRGVNIVSGRGNLDSHMKEIARGHLRP